MNADERMASAMQMIKQDVEMSLDSTRGLGYILNARSEEPMAPDSSPYFVAEGR
ncbi:MAG: hypothetical protein RBT51_10445 [Ectothiorhodospiraceae bacterium]|jgi:hypothetical protein|nr:hypothetical protein [Ectothiorhodospiraceae bacterium]